MPVARASLNTIEVYGETDIVVIRMCIRTDGSLNNKVRNGSTDKKLVNTRTNKGGVGWMTTSPGKIPFVFVSVSPNISKTMLQTYCV